MLLSLMTWLAAAGPGGSVSRCVQACQVLTDPAVRARACAACATAGNRAAWVEALAGLGDDPDRAIDQALQVPDWRVREAALAVRARSHRRPADLELARFLLAHPADGLPLALHVAAARKEPRARFEKSLRAVGRDGARAWALLDQHQEEARAALEVDLYDTDAAVQQDALEHLALWFGEAPAQVVLRAVASRPESGDPIAVAALLAQPPGEEPLGAAVLRAATAENQAVVNRVLVVLSQKLDAWRPRLKSLDSLDRRQAVLEVARLAPLSAPELQKALTDPDRVVRSSAGVGLARGEGKGLGALVESKVRAREAPGPDAWLQVLGEAAPRDCGEAAGRMVDDASLPPGTRGAALTALGRCQGHAVWPIIKGRLSDPVPEIRAGAVDALDEMGRVPEALGAAKAALADPAGPVVAAAVRVLSFPGQTVQMVNLTPLLSDPRPEVREAAAEGVARIGHSQGALLLGKRLKQEPEVRVRRALVHALLRMRDGPAMAALAEAAASDPDPGIRAVANDALTQGQTP